MYYFIVNTHSRTGQNREIWKKIEKRLERRGISYKVYNTKYRGHAAKLADRIITETLKTEDHVTLMVIGGDGTFNEVINGMHDFDRVFLGLIPTGSGNDLGRGLGISSERPVERLEELLDACKDLEHHVREMDLGQVTVFGEEEKYIRKYAISGGAGVDAAVCKEALTSPLKKFLNVFHLGSLTYGLLTVKNLFTMPLYDGWFTFTKEDGSTERHIFHKIVFCGAMNHKYEGGGVPMAPNASAFDGELSVFVLHDMPRFKCLVCFPFLIAGKHEFLHGVDIINCRKLSARLTHPLIIHADGEYCGEADRIEFECLPGKLRIIA